MYRISLTKPTMQAILTLLVVFLIDIFTPLGVATGVLYIFCFFLVCRQKKRIILAFAFITSILTATKFVVFLSPTITFIALVNRVITIIVIAIIAALAYRHRTLLDKRNIERSTYIKELEEMLFITSHGVRKPLATCLGLMQLIETDAPLSMEEMKKVVYHFKASALELDAVIKELSSFIYSIEQKDKNDC